MNIRRNLGNAYEELNAILWRGKNTKVVLLGHQKSGTTAIGNLLAIATNLSFSNDPIHQIDPASSNIMDELLVSGDEFIKNAPGRAKHLFKHVVKDPVFILALDTVFQIYPDASFMFIAREPVQIIRSIFNRLKIDGKTESNQIAENCMYKYTENWGYLINGKQENDGLNVVERIAYRIEKSTTEYLKHKERIQLAKYEDFVSSKQPYINELALKLGLKVKYDISEIVDQQFQPKGNADVNIVGFFGERNYEKIKDICRITNKIFCY